MPPEILPYLIEIATAALAQRLQNANYCTAFAPDAAQHATQLANEAQSALDWLKGDGPALQYPEQLTPALAHALGMPNFQCGPIAGAYRRAGLEIEKRSEAEQAFVLHKATIAVLKHGENWNKELTKEIRQMMAAADQAKGE